MNFRFQTLISRHPTPASCVLSEPSSALYGKVERSQRGNEFVPSEDDGGGGGGKPPPPKSNNNHSHSTKWYASVAVELWAGSFTIWVFLKIISVHAYNPLHNSWEFKFGNHRTLLEILARRRILYYVINNRRCLEKYSNLLKVDERVLTVLRSINRSRPCR